MVAVDRIKEGWQEWGRTILIVLLALAGWFILDLRDTAIVNSAVRVRLLENEKELNELRATVNGLAIESATMHNSVSQLDSLMKQVNANVEARTAYVSSLKSSIDEIHRTVEIGASGQAANLREVSKILGELGKQICSQQQCNHIQTEIDKIRK